MSFIHFLLSFSLTWSVSAQAEGSIQTREMAIDRSALVKDISYKLQVDVTNSETSFSGIQTINFMLSEPLKDLRVDFKGSKISKLTVNTQDVMNFSQEETAFYIPTHSLKVGKNEVKIEYSHPYSTNGSGLHRFKDLEDGEAYLYTHFEPQDAALFMPCFDQPDLKATFEFEATVPEHWTVISSKKEKQIIKAGDKKKKWFFPKTWPMSTYLFSFHAGPYKMWKAKADKVPLRFFARQSLAKHMDVGNWITYTKQGLGFFSTYFGYEYPFEKYDQIVVPEFNAGAMENIAAVTFSERFISRGKKTKLQKSNLAGIILHEMAHQWFGNLVTMKWWDDLWLNETFATFMAFKALTEATEFSESWKYFYVSEKAWAYVSDQLPTTHPVSTKVNNIDEAKSIFDGITYGKGAAAIKQLAYYVGENDFQSGLQSYFKLYAFKNATIQDFISALSQKTKHNLKTWSTAWLETSGVDTLTTDFECKNGKFEKLKIEITSATPEKPRTHAFNAVFLKEKRGRPQIIHTAIIKAAQKHRVHNSQARMP